MSRIELDDTQAPSGPADKTAVGYDAPAKPTPTPGLEPTLADRRPAPPPRTPMKELPVVDRAHYEILAEFARGGLGRIVRARDLRTGRIVAIKEMLGNADELAIRFEREARVTANLQHPSIVPVYEIGRWDNGDPFYAMKLVAGRSLHEVIAATPTLDERLRLLATVASVADALAYAHEQHVIHRDLKPANVLVGEFGETVVIDWGLAKVLGTADDAAPALTLGSTDLSQTTAGAVMGTPYYMPPEQASGAPIDARADVYAIGAILYHLVAGCPPYADRSPKSVAEIIKLVTDGHPTDLAVLAPGVPPDLVAVVKKAMRADARERYADARELSEDLRRFITGKLVRVHTYGWRTLVMRWVRRNRALVTVAASLVALLVAGTVVAFQKIIAERDVATESLSVALFQKGRAAEREARWADAAAFYARARLEHDSPATRWAAGIAEANAVVPHAHHRHAAPVTAVAMTGDHVVSADEAGHVVVWSLETGATAFEASFPVAVWSVAVRADGVIALGDDAGTIHLVTGELKPVRDLAEHGARVWSLAWSSDGELASGSEDSTVRIWNVGTGVARELRQHTARVYAVLYVGGGRLASASDDHSVIVWDLVTGAGRELGKNRGGGVRTLAVTPRNQLFSTGWDWDGRVWDLETSAQIGSWTDDSSVHAMAMTRDGLAYVTAGDFDDLVLWDAETRQRVTTIALHHRTHSLAISSDDRWLVSGGTDGDVVAWQLGEVVARLIELKGHTGPIESMVLGADGKSFATGSLDGTVRVWGLDGKQLWRGTLGEGCAYAVSALTADELFASCTHADGTSGLTRWRREGNRFVPEPPLPTSRWMRITTIGADGATLIGGHLGGDLAVADLRTGQELRRVKAHDHHLYAIDATPDRSRIATGGLDNYVKVWSAQLENIASWKMETTNGVLGVAISPDGSTVAAGDETGRMTVWDVASKRTLVDLPHAHAGTIWRMTYSRDGRWVYAAADDGITKWDAATWTPAARFDSQDGVVQRLVLAPDQTTLVGVHRSGAVVVWNVETGRPTARIGGRGRELGSCDDISVQPFASASHREAVARACSSSPREQADRVRAYTHLRISDGLEPVLDWD